MSKPFRCQYCNCEDEMSFWPTNKGKCKKCISCLGKINRKTVKSHDLEVKTFCETTGRNFDEIISKCESERLTRVPSDEIPTALKDAQVKIDSLTQENIVQATKINELIKKFTDLETYISQQFYEKLVLKGKIDGAIDNKLKEYNLFPQ